MSHRLVERLLRPQGLAARFQPIFSFQGGEPEIFALESLVNAADGASGSEGLFDSVRESQLEWRVDRACALLCLEIFSRLATELPLTLNVHPSTLARQDGFVDLLLETAARGGFLPDRLVIEIVEKSPEWDWEALSRARERLRACGVSVAQDDFGIGQASLRYLIDCRPDYVKIDRYLVQEIAGCSRRRKLVASILALSQELDFQVVAEGVEQRADLDTLLGLGCQLFQGNLLAPPMKQAEIERLDSRRALDGLRPHLAAAG